MARKLTDEERAARARARAEAKEAAAAEEAEKAEEVVNGLTAEQVEFARRTNPEQKPEPGLR